MIQAFSGDIILRKRELPRSSENYHREVHVLDVGAKNWSICELREPREPREPSKPTNPT